MFNIMGLFLWDELAFYLFILSVQTLYYIVSSFMPGNGRLMAFAYRTTSWGRFDDLRHSVISHICIPHPLMDLPPKVHLKWGKLSRFCRQLPVSTTIMAFFLYSGKIQLILPAGPQMSINQDRSHVGMRILLSLAKNLYHCGKLWRRAGGSDNSGDIFSTDYSLAI